MHLRHLGLPVRNLQRSLAFYTRYFGFQPATAQTFSDGTVIVRDGDRFDLALHEVAEVAAPTAFLHFGFVMPNAHAVRALRAQMEGDAVPIVEQEEEADHVSFKCIDPDGWRVEVYWDAAPSG